MTQAIMTKFIGPSTHRGSRAKAFCDAGSLTLNWDHELNTIQNHERVARELAKKLEWEWNHAGGSLPSNIGGYVFVSKI